MYRQELPYSGLFLLWFSCFKNFCTQRSKNLYGFDTFFGLIHELLTPRKITRYTVMQDEIKSNLLTYKPLHQIVKPPTQLIRI